MASPTETATLPERGPETLKSDSGGGPSLGIPRWQSLRWMMVIAFLFRVVLILTHGTYHQAKDHPYGFGYETGSIARSIAAGEGFSSPFLLPTGPTTWIGPVYPYLCATVFKLFGIYSDTSGFVILALNSLFAALTCIPILRIAERCLTRSTGLWAGWIWAVLPFFSRWPTTWVWDTALSAFLLTVLVAVALSLEGETRAARWVGFGALWGFSALANPALLTALPFSYGWSGRRWYKHGNRVLRNVLFSLLVCAVMVAPWIIRNRVVLGKWVFIRGNFGLELRLGNYRGSAGLGWGGLHPALNRMQFDRYQRMGEIAFVEEKKQEALLWIKQNPAEFFRLTAKRFLLFWDGEPVLYTDRTTEPWSPWEVALLSLLTAFGLLLAIDRKIKAAWLFAAVLLVYPAPYYITYVMTRYRHALEPLMLILAVYFVQIFGSRLRSPITACKGTDAQ